MEVREIVQLLNDRAEDVAAMLLPGGKREGREWIAGSVNGEAGRSCKIAVEGSKRGVFADFATGESGDLLDLWQATKDITLAEAVQEAKKYLGIQEPKFENFTKKSFRKPTAPKTAKKVIEGSAVQQYLVGRGLPQESLSAYRIGEVAEIGPFPGWKSQNPMKGPWVVFPSFRGKDLVFVKFLHLQRKDGKKFTLVEPGCEPILFGWQAIPDNARTVILTEGEIDAITYHAYGFPALSVPFGGGKGGKQQWIDTEFPHLDRFEEIILSLDQDEEGQKATEELINRLGRHRCRVVVLPCKDINECRQQGVTTADIEKLIADAQSHDPSELKTPLSFGQAVIDEFYPPAGELPGFTLPWKMRKRPVKFLRGEVSLWTGINGHGKSLVLNQIAVSAMTQGERVCIASFEMHPRKTLSRLTRQALGKETPERYEITSTLEWLGGKLWVNEAGIRQQKQIADILTSRGHDGIVLRNSLNPRTGEYVGADEVVVFPKEMVEKQKGEPQINTKNPLALETARQTAAETLNSVYPESSPDIGLAVKPGMKRDDTVTMPQPHTDKAGNFTFADPRVEERWKAANGLADGPSLLDRTKSFIHKMLSETRHFPELDDSSFAGKRTSDILRRFESSAVAAKAKTAEHLHGLTATFGPKKMDIFTRKVILDDLMNEADKGRGLPFGYTPGALQNDHAAVSKIVETHPDIKAAIERRADVNKALVMDLVDNALLPVESVLKPEALPRYQKTGKYSPNDINTGYFRHQVLEYANARRWAGVSTAGDVRNKQRGWQKGRQGSELDINTNFLEAEFEVFSQGLKELATKKTLDEVLTLNDLVPELKAQAKKEGVADWKDLILEGHVVWQPEKGSMFYRGQTMPEQIVNKFISENPHFAEIAKKFREVTILGGKKAEVVIPSGLAKTLDSLRTDRETATLDTVNQKMLGAWKIWTLLSPRRAIKYNLNNMSGDLDAAIAADPAIVIKHFNTAWKNAWNRRAGRAMSKDEIDMLDRGVIDSGISINEIPDINKLPGFSRLSEAERQEKLIAALRSGDLSKLAPPNVIAKYFYFVSELSQLREGLLREAAYMRAKELMEQGKKVYWASKPSEIEALPDIKDKAAKLSRELLGDYGNLSAHGEKIRARFIPFWSWMEINTPRYYRLFQNAAAKGEGGSTAARMAGVGTRKIAGATLGIAEKVLLTQVLFATVTAFNHLVHPDEEDLLGETDQNQLHVILGTKADGKIMTARFQGAFSDALSWFGLEDYPKTLRDFRDGKMEPGELAKKMLLATPNKIANSAAPFFKLGGELITGKSIYPDITKPFQIRDKVEHAARFLSLDNEYKAMTGKPTRGYLDSLKGLYLYENDPGEIAYQNTRRLSAKYLEKNGKESVSGEPTARSNALYYYKQALRFDDEAAADKYKEEYQAAGGTQAGIKASVAKAHPMWTLPLNQRAKFRQSLSADELETLQRGIDWYRQVYAP